MPTVRASAAMDPPEPATATRPARAVGVLLAVLPFVLAAVVTFFAFFPGHANGDTGGIYLQARGQVPVNNWHPTMNVVILYSLFQVWDSPAAVLAFQCALIWGGLALSALALRRRFAGPVALFLVPIGFMPVVFNYIGVLIKDTLSAGFTLVAIAVLLVERVATKGNHEQDADRTGGPRGRGRLWWVHGGGGAHRGHHVSTAGKRASTGIIPMAGGAPAGGRGAGARPPVDAGAPTFRLRSLHAAVARSRRVGHRASGCRRSSGSAPRSLLGFARRCCSVAGFWKASDSTDLARPAGTGIACRSQNVRSRWSLTSNGKNQMISSSNPSPTSTSDRSSSRATSKSW